MYNKVELCGVNTAELPILSEQEKRDLLTRARAGDKKARQSMIEGNLRLVLSVIQRFSGRGESMDDLFQVGVIGLIKAIDHFNTELNVKFSTYAVPKIAGEIRRFLRDDGMVKVGRGRKEQALLIHRARTQLTAQLGREPVLSELAQVTGLTPEDIAAADLAVASVASLQAESGENGLSLEGMVGSESPEEGMVEKVALHTAINRLPERERKLIFLRYYKGFTQDKTAKVLGISQVQVSRLEKKSILFLRGELSDD